MLTRDSERVIEVLLLAAALLAAVVLDIDDAARPTARDNVPATQPFESDRNAANGAVEASMPSTGFVAAGPFRALGAQVRRAVQDLSASSATDSSRSC